MITDKLLWWLIPGFVLVSGNFSPLRIGPILPIFGLLIIYVLSQCNQLNIFFQRKGLVVLAMSVVTLGAILVAAYTVSEYNLQGNEFEGAIHPIAYSIMSLCRFLLVVLVLVVLTRYDVFKYRGWWKALLTSYCVILFPLYVQTLSHVFFNIDFGYLFSTESGMRYGGLIGEPQTISAWLFSFFSVLYFGLDNNNKASGLVKFLLIFSILMALFMTQSTAWILGFFIFVLLRARLGMIALLLLVVVAFGVYESVIDKIIADIFTVSERSVTILAGAELFMTNSLSMLFGYGVGLTPYLINNTDVFYNYPIWSLSDLGRQTVMNSYLEVFFEFGLIGGLLYFYLLVKGGRITSLRQVLPILPILVGIFGISGGFSSGYFLISVPLLLRLTKERQPVM